MTEIVTGPEPTREGAHVLPDRIHPAHSPRGAMCEVVTDPPLVTMVRGISASPHALSGIMRIFRTYARAYAHDLDAVLVPLTAVTGEPVSTRFTMPNGSELATVGQVLVVAGDERVLEPYRATAATLIIDDLDECRAMRAVSSARFAVSGSLVAGRSSLYAVKTAGAENADGAAKAREVSRMLAATSNSGSARASQESTASTPGNREAFGRSAGEPCQPAWRAFSLRSAA